MLATPAHAQRGEGARGAIANGQALVDPAEAEDKLRGNWALQVEEELVVVGRGGGRERGGQRAVSGSTGQRYGERHVLEICARDDARVNDAVGIGARHGGVPPVHI